MNQYMSSADLKANAREQLWGHYGPVIGALVLMYIIEFALDLLTSASVDLSTPVGFTVFYLVTLLLSVIGGVFSAGYCFMFLKISCGQAVSAGDVFYAFQHNTQKVFSLSLFVSLISELLLLPGTIFFQLYSSNMNTVYMLLASICTVICSVILVIFSLTFSQVYFLLMDFPEYTVRELLDSSVKIMKGNRGRLFYIYVSFIPLILLSLLSIGIAMLWVVPYIQGTVTNFYLDTMRNRK